MWTTSYFCADFAIEKMEQTLLGGGWKKYLTTAAVIEADGVEYRYGDMREEVGRVMEYVSENYDVLALQPNSVYVDIKSSYGIFNVEMPIFCVLESSRENRAAQVNMQFYLRRTPWFGWRLKRAAIEYYAPESWEEALNK
jgi:hypothetical protein